MADAGEFGDLNIAAFNFSRFLALFRIVFTAPNISQALINSAVDIIGAAQVEDLDGLTDTIVNELAERDFIVDRAVIKDLLIESLGGGEPDGDDEPGNGITEVIDDSIDGLKGLIGELFDKVFRAIEDGARTTDDLVRSTGASIAGDILGRIGEWARDQDNILGTIARGIEENTGILGDIFRQVMGRVEVTVLNNIIIPDQVFDVIITGVGDILDGERGFIEGIFSTLMETIQTIFLDQIEEQVPALEGISEAIREQTATEETADEKMLEQVELINDDTEAGTGASFVKAALTVIEQRIRDGEPPNWKAFYKGFDDQVSAQCGEPVPIYSDDVNNQRPVKEGAGGGNWVFNQGIDAYKKMWEIQQEALAELLKYVAKTTGIIDSPTNELLENLYYYLAKAQGILTITGALAQRELYEFSLCTPWQILEVGDAVTAYQKNLITRQQLETDIRMRGYNEARTQVLIEAAYQVPDIAALYSMNLRGLAAGENLNDRFQDLGYSPSDAEALEALKFYIPPPQDLITMAVREVFNPTIVQKFGQDQDFPEEFAEYAEMQGISRFWAEKYWQAHWVLPSVQMGYEMLHRRVIDETTLKQLLAAQDVMPGWRDALIAISYRPYTRVDIRRMHDVGVLNDDEVYEAYRDIGYNDAKAKNLTEFTIRLNRPDPDDIESLEGLTRASIINAFKDGLITRQTADDLLKLEGIGEAARDVFLTVAELDADREERKDEVDTLLTEFENGAKSILEVQVGLSGLPLSNLEREKAELKLRKAAAKKVKLPSKADLDKMFKNGLIDVDTYEDQLERIGYPDRWIRRYRQLIEGGIATDA